MYILLTILCLQNKNVSFIAEEILILCYTAICVKKKFKWFWYCETYIEERCIKHKSVYPEAGGNNWQHTVSTVENADQHRALHQQNINSVKKRHEAEI